jgi:hypothetical protein
LLQSFGEKSLKIGAKSSAARRKYDQALRNVPQSPVGRDGREDLRLAQPELALGSSRRYISGRLPNNSGFALRCRAQWRTDAKQEGRAPDLERPWRVNSSII